MVMHPAEGKGFFRGLHLLNAGRTTSKSKQWSHVATFFRNHRRLKWTTIRLMTNGAKAKRMEFRIRHTIGYLRYVGRVQLVCSEPKKRPEGRRRYLACNDVNVQPARS